MAVTSELLRFVPEGATHCLVEERAHRGAPVYAVVAVVPHGASIVLNGYSGRELAERTASEITAQLAPTPSAACVRSSVERGDPLAIMRGERS